MSLTFLNYIFECFCLPPVQANEHRVPTVLSKIHEQMKPFWDSKKELQSYLLEVRQFWWNHRALKSRPWKGTKNKPNFMINPNTGKCLTPTQLLICSSFSRENGHFLLICSSLSTSQNKSKSFRIQYTMFSYCRFASSPCFSSRMVRLTDDMMRELTHPPAVEKEHPLPIHPLGETFIFKTRITLLRAMWFMWPFWWVGGSLILTIPEVSKPAELPQVDLLLQDTPRSEHTPSAGIAAPNAVAIATHQSSQQQRQLMPRETPATETWVFPHHDLLLLKTGWPNKCRQWPANLCENWMSHCAISVEILTDRYVSF